MDTTMREIKFRVYYPSKWDDNDNPTDFEMSYDWAFEEYAPINDQLKILQDTPHHHVMQFTGLHDKEGKEIYHKDVIDIEAGNPYDVIEGPHIVVWDLSGWYIKRCDGVDYTDVDFSDLALYNFVKVSSVIGISPL